MSQPILVPTVSTADPARLRSELTQSSATVPTWSYWESLGYSDESPVKAEYFVRRMWPKDQPVKILNPSEREKAAKGVLPAPLSIRRRCGDDVTEFIYDALDDGKDLLEEDCATTEEDDSDYEEDPEIDLDSPRFRRKIFG